MRTTAQRLAGWFVIAAGLQPAVLLAGSPSGAHLAWMAGAVQGQIPRAASGDARREAEDWLRRARQALEQGNVSLAESCVAQAERLNVTFDPLGETPASVRRDLDAKRQPGPSTAGLNIPGPATNRGMYDPQVSQTGLPSAAAPNANRNTCDSMLVQARQALALGDVSRATKLVERAEALKVQYAATEDSPTKVQALLVKYQQLVSENARGNGNSDLYRKRRADLLLEQAEALKNWNQLDDAERLANDARRLNVRYSPYDRTPDTLLDQITTTRQGAGVKAAGGVAGNSGLNSSLYNPPGSITPTSGSAPVQPFSQVAPTGGSSLPQSTGRPVIRPQVQPVAGSPVRSLPPTAQPVNFQEDQFGNSGNDIPPAGFPADMSGGSEAQRLFAAGEEALRNRELDKAVQLYRDAYAFRDQLEPAIQQKLQDRLQMLSPKPSSPTTMSGGTTGVMTEADASRQVLINQLSAEVTRKQIEHSKFKETDPKKAISILQDAKVKVETSEVEQGIKDTLIRRLDNNIADVQKYMSINQPKLDLEERNRNVKNEIARESLHKVEVEEKLALMCNEFNKLMEERRYMEAEIIANKAKIMAPQEAVVQNMVFQSRFVREYQRNMDVKDAKAQGFADSLANVDKSAIPFDDNIPYQHGNAREWRQLTESRAALDRKKNRLSDTELEIEQKLKTPVSLQFTNKPLNEVVDYLARLAAINVVLDPQGMADEGVLPSTPVTINVQQPISLKSALNLILQPLHLDYVIKDEVLKVTSKSIRSGDVYTEVYPVADLVIPIPNFVPSSSMGLSAAIQEALGNTGNQMPGIGGRAPVTVLAGQNGGTQNAMINPNVLAQNGGGGNMFGGGGGGGGSMAGGGMGVGGVGSGSQPDFDSLIDLVTQTVKPTSWQEVGGPGSIKPYEQNLTLIVSQTQDVHEQIADLLEQLRRLQDLQVTLEVRFITLNDNFFERIGIDFDFDIDDDSDGPYQVFGREDATTGTRNVADRDHGKNNAVVGLSAPGVFSADLDIPMQQGSFGLAAPQFGGYQAGAGAQMGFAILSDIEAFFFVEASQGDQRSNVLQAPKVTLFNGQVAFVADTSQSPFVISVIPVVGDFAAAFQPVVVVLSEGTFLTVQAVVSKDKRFVRLTMVPFFSSIGNVDEFTFTGSSTTIKGTSNEDDEDGGTTSENETQIRSGTTVQLPTFNFVTVTTTVSVPDGGTVLLGGIKRLSEGRREFGVPILNKLPYVNRLFSNVGIGRDTQSLMMMVTPRIIIQEEEEALLGVTNN